MAALFILGSGAQEAQVRIKNVFDSEEDIPEASLTHQSGQLVAVICDTGSHRLDDVIDAVKLCLHDLPTQRLESLDVESDVVIHQENGSCAAVVGVLNICNHSVEVICMKIASTHFDDGTEAAIESTASRSLHHINLPSQHRVATEYARTPSRRSYFGAGQVADRSLRVVMKGIAAPIGQTRNLRVIAT